MTIFESLVEQYRPQNEEQRMNAQRETMQKIVLAGLRRGGFFEHAAFYGGTCLRLIHGLRRFSERFLVQRLFSSTRRPNCVGIKCPCMEDGWK